MKLPGTLQTPAEIAAELGLTGLFVMGGTADESRYNHADGTSGTVVGTPTYAANSVTFPQNVYIDTGVAETASLTLAGAMAKLGTFRGLIQNVNGEGDIICGLRTNNFGFRLQFIASGNKSGSATDQAAATGTANEASKSADNCILGIGCYPYSATNARIWEPRYQNEEVLGAMSGSGRVVVGTNYRIGWCNGTTADTTVYLAACADTVLTDAQQADLFVWMSKFLIARGIYP